MNKRPWRVLAVALGVAGVGLLMAADPLMATGRKGPSPTMEYKGTPQTGITEPAVKPNLACQVWFAKDANGTKLTELIYPATEVHAVWLFVSVKNDGKVKANNFQVSARVHDTSYTVAKGTNTKNVTWITNFTTALGKVKGATTIAGPLAPGGTTKPWNSVGKLVFLSQQEVQGQWAAGSGYVTPPPHSAFIKMHADAHVSVFDIDHTCVTGPEILSIRYDNLP
jgi:hypothetical protein